MRRAVGVIAICVLSSSGPLSAFPLITNVVETGGDNETTDTITAKWTGVTFSNGVSTEFPTPYTVPLFGEDAPCYVDRAHQWNGVSMALPLPGYLVGGEYVMIGNDNRDNADFRLDISVAQDVLVYLLIDNRLGDGAAGDPPAGGLPFSDWTNMTWMATAGFNPVLNGLNRSQNPTVPDEVAIDGDGNGFGPGDSIADYASVYVKRAPAGTFTLYQADNPSRNVYGVVVTLAPEQQPPQVTNLMPASKAMFQSSATPITFTVTTVSPNQIAAQDIRLFLNGTDVTSALAVSGTPTSRQAVYNGTLAPNVFYAGRIVAMDNAGRASTNDWQFDTVDQPAALMVEAEDYNFSESSCGLDGNPLPAPAAGGGFIDNPTPSFAGAWSPTSYTDRVGMREADYFDTAASTGDVSNNKYRFCDPVGTQEATDVLRQKYIDYMVSDYQVHLLQPGEWLNYTRTFPAGNYFVYLRFNSRTNQEVRLEQVISDRSQAGQASMILGSFAAPRAIGYQYAPLADNAGQPVILGLSGVQTLRLRALGANNDLSLNYLMLVQTGEPSTVLRPYVESVSPAPGAENVPAHAPLEMVLVNRSTSVNTNTLQLELDGVSVLAVSTLTGTPAGWNLKHTPPAPFALGSTHAAVLRFADSESQSQTQAWSFTITADDTPPAVGSVRPTVDSISQAVSLTVLLSESVTRESLTNRANYTINKGATVTSVVPGASDASIILEVAGVSAGTYYLLTVSNLRDPVGNVMPAGQSVRFNASPFQEDLNGFLVVEAENYMANRQGAGSSPEWWTLVTDRADYSGIGAMQSLPDNGGTSPSETQLAQSPHMEYRVRLANGGRHYIWIRGSAGPGGGGSDSLHFGLDGAHVGAMAGINNTVFVWSRSVYNNIGFNYFDVPAPGDYTLDVWMREDGAYIDKFVITTNSAYTPTGVGPDESRRVGDPYAPSIVITAPASGAVFTNGASFAMQAQVADPDSAEVRVEFFVDGLKVGEDTSAPYVSPTQTLAPGRYTLTARATDEVGMIANSSAVRVQVGELPPQILMVVGDPASVGPGDAGVRDRLTGFGFEMVLVDDTASATEDAILKALVITSSTVGSANVAAKFRDVAVPVLNWEQAIQDDYMMTGNNTDSGSGPIDRGDLADQTTMNLTDANHAMAAGLSLGPVALVTTPTNCTFGVPASSAIVIGTMVDDPTRAMLYGYETGAAMIGGFVAPARRVHIFLGDNTFASLTEDGVKLFDAAASWAMNRSLLPPAQSVRLTGARISGGQFQFSFATVTGRSYRVEHRDSLSAGDWIELRTEAGTGGDVTITDAVGGGARFYRVLTE